MPSAGGGTEPSGTGHRHVTSITSPSHYLKHRSPGADPSGSATSRAACTPANRASSKRAPWMHMTKLGPECRFLLAGFGNDTAPPPLDYSRNSRGRAFAFQPWQPPPEPLPSLWLCVFSVGRVGCGWLWPVRRYHCPSLVACRVTSVFFAFDGGVGSGPQLQDWAILGIIGE